MNSSPKTSVGLLTSAGYCVGSLLILISAFDFLSTIWPFAPGDVSWRYGAAGFLAGYTLTPLLGGFLLASVAALAGHQGALRLIGLLHLLAAILVLAVIGAFGLDALQIQRQTQPDARGFTNANSARAVIKLGLTLVAVAWVGIAGLRQARRLRGATTSRPSELVVGGQPG